MMALGRSSYEQTEICPLFVEPGLPRGDLLPLKEVTYKNPTGFCHTIVIFFSQDPYRGWQYCRINGCFASILKKDTINDPAAGP